MHKSIQQKDKDWIVTIIPTKWLNLKSIQKKVLTISVGDAQLNLPPKDVKFKEWWIAELVWRQAKEKSSLHFPNTKENQCMNRSYLCSRTAMLWLNSITALSKNSVILKKIIINKSISLQLSMIDLQKLLKKWSKITLMTSCRRETNILRLQILKMIISEKVSLKSMS